MTFLIVLGLILVGLFAASLIDEIHDAQRERAARRFRYVMDGHTDRAVARRKANTESVGRMATVLRIKP